MDQNSKPDPFGFKLPRIGGEITLSAEAERRLQTRLLISIDAKMQAAVALIAGVLAGLEEEPGADPSAKMEGLISQVMGTIDSAVAAWSAAAIKASETGGGPDELDRRPPSPAGPS